MQKPRLMTPGPAPVPEDVLLELARPVIHHRSAEAKQVITEVAAGLKEVLQTAHDVLILTASGTGAIVRVQVPVAALALAPALAIGLGVVLSLLTGRRASGLRPAAVLRAE